MSDYLLHCAASNWCVSSVLAAFAWFAQVKLRRPVIAHLMWLLVLVKLVTPPLFSLAVLPAPVAELVPMVSVPVSDAAIALRTPIVEAAVVASAIDATSILLGTWLVGSVIVLLWSSTRIVRFHRLLTLASRPAPRDLQERAAKLAPQLGLRKLPSINVTSARVSPMVWWLGGQVRIFIPAAMPAELGAAKMRWILAHELAHVRRGDHYVRWLEWLACVAFWWNPIAWLARRNLRANEEVCCDALVLRSFEGKPHSYANSLLAAVEFLASPGLRPPAMASEINSGGFLERRFRMIVSKTPIATTPRWLQAVLLVGTVAVMPLGVAYAQNPDVGAVTKRFKKAVQAGELTGEQARSMLGTLKKQAAQDPKKAKRSRPNKETAHYKRLVESLREGLHESIRSGKIDKEQASDLYHRQMARLKNDAQESADRRAAQAKDRRKKNARQTPKEYYRELTRSLEDGLREGLKSGRINEEEAAKLFKRDLARIQKAASEANSRQAEMRARRANELERRDLEVQMADRERADIDYSKAKQEYEKATKAAGRARKPKDRDQEHRQIERKHATLLRVRESVMKTDLEAAKRQMKAQVDQLRQKQVELEKRYADINRQAKERAEQMRALERSLVDKQRSLDLTEREVGKLRASDFLKAQNSREKLDVRRDQWRKVEYEVLKKEHDLWKSQNDPNKNDKAKKRTITWDTRIEATKAKAKTDKANVRWDTRADGAKAKAKKDKAKKDKPNVRWDTRTDGTKSKKRQADRDSDQWKSAVDLRRARTARNTAAAAAEALKADVAAQKAKHMAQIAEQIARDREAVESAPVTDYLLKASDLKLDQLLKTKRLKTADAVKQWYAIEQEGLQREADKKQVEADIKARAAAKGKAKEKQSRTKRGRRTGIR